MCSGARIFISIFLTLGAMQSPVGVRGMSRSFGPLEGAVEHQLDAAYCSAAQAGISMPALSVHTAIFHQVFVQLLEVTGGQLLQPDCSNGGMV